MQTKTLIFDYDGTIHDSLAIYKPAFLKAYDYLVDQGLRPKRAFKDSEISRYLGMSPKEMWDDFGKDLDHKIKNKASTIITQEMAYRIENHQAKLYPNAMKVLKTLKDKGYNLVFLSNCKTNYMKHHNQTFKLFEVFDDMIAAEMFDFLPKHAILKKMIHRYKNPIAVIGDRIHDVKAAKENDLLMVGCLYGFSKDNELDGSDYYINDIKELLEIF